jgi:hypothetical protein
LESSLQKGDEAQSVSYCFRCKGVSFFEKVNSSAEKKLSTDVFIASEWFLACTGEDKRYRLVTGGAQTNL